MIEYLWLYAVGFVGIIVGFCGLNMSHNLIDKILAGIVITIMISWNILVTALFINGGCIGNCS